MKKLLVIFAAAAMMTSLAAAQTATGNLTVTAKVAGSINLVFNSDTANGVPLSQGAGTANATLDFGNVSAFGSVAPKVTRTATATDFTVSTPVDVFVTSANSASANYTLQAALNGADPNSWFVNGAAFSNTTAGTATATGTYGSNVPVTLAITIKQSVPAGTAINNIVVFTATAN